MPPVPDPAPSIVALADQCVKCGLCLPHCPTYRVGREEGESPRGRIALAHALATGQIATDARAARHIDSCLACRACEHVCPPGVRYGALLRETRALLNTRRGRPGRLRGLRWLLGSPRRVELGLGLLRLARCTGLARLTARLGWTPPADALPTPPARQSIAERDGGTRGEVFLFLGCIARRYDADVHAAAARLLAASGYRVRVPSGQGCCGAALAHAGERRAAHGLAAALAGHFPGTAPILVSSSGCHEAVREALGDRAIDVHAFLAGDEGFASLRFRTLDLRIAVHRPCTLRHVSGGGDALLRLLARIPGLDPHLLPERGRCCGAAGIHFLEHPAQSRVHRDELLAQLAAVDAAALCSSNVGCRLWLEAGLSTTPTPLPIYHPLQLLDRQLHIA